jgi:hypothetical protein
MAIHALWEDRYGLSIRKGPIDLSKLSATVDADANVDVASHNNDGTPTASQMLDGTTQVGGDQHFNARDTTTTGQGRVIGQRISTGSSIVFGMPVIGNPDFSTGQETIEVQKTDGFATQRVGAANEASDIFRAGQNPSTSFDFVATGKSVVHAAAVFFQNGLKETSGLLRKKVAKFPSSGDGSDPIYYGSFLRKISANAANSRILSDGVGTSFTLRASQTEPLTCSLGMSGRIMGSEFDVSTDNGGLTESVSFGLDGKKNYLLQDSMVTFENKKHTIIFTSGTGTFASGDIVTGGTSGATGTFSSLTGTTAGALFLTGVVGTFTASETISGSGSSATGTVTRYGYMSARTITHSGESGGPFVVAEVITATTSGKVATVLSVGSGTMTITGYTGNFLTSGVDVITGGTSAATANVETEQSMGVALAVESFDINCSAEVTPNRFNTFFPLNLVLGNYTVDGSFTVAALGKGVNILDGNDFQMMMADAGAGKESTQAASIIPRQVAFSWVSGISDNSGAEVALPEPSASQDLQVKCNVVITDVSWGGDTEATMTISWRSMNQFTAGTDTLISGGDAINLIYYDDQTVSWGYNQAIKVSPINGATNNFVVGETITGGTSTYTATILAISGNILSISNPTGILVLDETITGSTSAATGKIDS